MDILQKYYESKMALDILSLDLEEQKKAVTEYLLTLPERKAEIAGAKFHIKRDFVYEFSEKALLVEQKTKGLTDILKKKITEAQLAVKQIKAIEIEDGTAKLLETTYAPVIVMSKEKGAKS